MKFAKKTGLLCLSVASAACAFLGASALSGAKTFEASADNATMSVDVFGNLVWEDVAGADGYTWTYTVGGKTSSVYQTEKNEANVGLAIMEAVNVAKANSESSASVQFNVTPNGAGAEMVYTYPITQYVKFGYSTHDISDVNEVYKTSEKSLEEMGSWISSAVYKNDLFTVALETEVELDPTYGVTFGLFCDRKSTGTTAITKNPNYRVRLTKNGTMSICKKGDKYSSAGDAATTNNVAVALNEKYYLSMGVFDTYDLNGKIGETVYCSRSQYDEATDSLVLVSELSHFYTTAEIEAAGIVYEYAPPADYAAKDQDGSQIMIERSSLIISAYGKYDNDADGTAETAKSNAVYVSAGKPTYKKMSAPTGIYYDNVNQTVVWNKVENAKEYEWRIGNENWTKISANAVELSDLIDDYNGYGYLPFSVRAVGENAVGMEAIYRIDLSVSYKNPILKDLTEVYPYTSQPTEFYSVNAGNGATGGGAMQKELDISLNTHVTFAFTTNADTPAQERFLLLRLLRDTSNMYAGQYTIVLWGDGTVFLTPHWAKTTNVDTSDLQTGISANFRMAKVTDGFKAGVKYYVTFGVDEVYEKDVKMANRIIARVEEETENGLGRKTLGVLSYDFKHFDKWTEENAIQLGAHSDVVSLWQAKNLQIKTNVGLMVNNELVATEEVEYGAWYDLSKKMSTVSAKGYTINGWEYEEDGKTYSFSGSGIWNKYVLGGGFLVKARTTPISYNVSYNVESDNPSTYTIESDWALKAPTTVPTGKIFAGWYDANDTAFTAPITTLQGKTGDIVLVARFVNGYNITVDGQKHTWTEDDAAFTLVREPIEGKTFVKWQVLQGGTYEDYNGAETFVPTADMTFISVYEWTEYSLTYVAEGASHQNATKYTMAAPVTFNAASKDGYFFLGWYKENTFETQIVTTENYKGNLTLYAKFERKDLPATIIYGTDENAQSLPVLQLPSGSRYTVALYKDGKELQITNDTYAFVESGEYLLKYAIVLPTGEVVNHDALLNVKQVYTVTLHYGDGETSTLKKFAGEKITEEELPEALEGYEFVGVYKDSQFTDLYAIETPIEANLDLYVYWKKAGDSEEQDVEEGGCKGCKSSIVGASSVVVLGAAGLVLLKRKKDD